MLPRHKVSPLPVLALGVLILMLAACNLPSFSMPVESPANGQPNRRLTERVVAKLGAAGIDVRLHHRVPANDGGLCFGQIIESLAVLQASMRPFSISAKRSAIRSTS